MMRNEREGEGEREKSGFPHLDFPTPLWKERRMYYTSNWRTPRFVCSIALL